DSPVLDMVIVCRKTREKQRVNWTRLIEKAEKELLETVKELRMAVGSIRRADLVSIVRGKILELYSRYDIAMEETRDPVITPKTVFERVTGLIDSIDEAGNK
ncbi:MAG: hypothetical protein ACFFD4_22490, partial [Candidatus Odinarchaeota archaeon]